MAKDKRSELSDTIESVEEELYGDTPEERKFSGTIRKALREGRLPIECIEYIEIEEDVFLTTVVMKEC